MKPRVSRALLLVGLLSGCDTESPELPMAGPAATQFLSGAEGLGYSRVLESRPFVFPEDHGSHPNYRSEWWYFTGNLVSEAERRYGFELTFFRFALAPELAERSSEWATNQAWMAHLSLTDGRAARFVAAERFSRQAMGLAGNDSDPFLLRLEDWSVASSGLGFFPLKIVAGTDDGEIQLTLTAGKDPVENGENGLDQKGPEVGNASYYYSITRLRASGEIRVGERKDRVSGLAWMDREWGTSALSRNLEGWDWFALQLTDGRDLMYYRLRSDQGDSSPYSSGTLVEADGSHRTLSPDEVSLTVLEHWQSPTSGAEYPVGWELAIPAEQIRLEIRPLIPHQELDLTVRYWEGAVIATGMAENASLSGRGYLELTGY